jgi:methylmalonyl-CoA epimerase
MNTSFIWQVDHIGIAVSDLEQAVSIYTATTGARVITRESLPDHGVSLAFLETGGAKIELIAPLTQSSSLARFIANRGPGLHHICYRVNDVAEELTRLESQGYDLIDRVPRPGAGKTKVAFISPKSFTGVLTELMSEDL